MQYISNTVFRQCDKFGERVGVSWVRGQMRVENSKLTLIDLTIVGKWFEPTSVGQSDRRLLILRAHVIIPFHSVTTPLMYSTVIIVSTKSIGKMHDRP